MLSQLIYVSNRNIICSDEEIKMILQKSIERNSHKNITGVLLYSKTKFLQVLEGEYDEISLLYDKIKTDQRHSKATLISIKPIEERYFPSWQMGSREIDTESYSFLTEMNDDEKYEFKNLLNGETQDNAIVVINKLFH
jgi:hypothetical protein